MSSLDLGKKFKKFKKIKKLKKFKEIAQKKNLNLNLNLVNKKNK